MNKLVLICLVAWFSYMGITPTKAVTLTGGGSSDTYNTYQTDRDDDDNDETEDDDDDDDEIKVIKAGTPVPFELSPTTGALALVSWGVVCTLKRRK